MQERINRLYERRTFGIRPGLETELALLEKLGNPEKAYKAVHVAGTNGKGSVCAVIESVLRAAGYKTGLYTSPHLVHLNERFRVNGSLVSDKDLDSLMEVVEEASLKVKEDTGREATFFEYTTAMAFEYFRRMNVDVAVVETGLGGRLDATNVVYPVLSVITGIGLEHTEYLGNDIETIAGEKSGIIKPGRPVVCGVMDESACEVVRKTAKERMSIFIKAGENASISAKSANLAGQKLVIDSSGGFCGTVMLPLQGSHQIENLGTALAALEWLASAGGFVITNEALKEGIESVVWPGRMQIINNSPLTILDGAHNPNGAEPLAKNLVRLRAGKPVGLVIGMCADKDIKRFLEPFRNMVVNAWVVPIGNERNVNPDIIVNIGISYGWNVSVAGLAQALGEAGEWAGREDGCVCITGSLFLVGAVMETLEIVPFAGGKGENV